MEIVAPNSSGRFVDVLDSAFAHVLLSGLQRDIEGTALQNVVRPKYPQFPDPFIVIHPVCISYLWICIINVCMHMHVCLSVCLYFFVCMYVCMYVLCMYVLMYACMYVSMYVLCIYRYIIYIIYACICTYIYIHIYIFICVCVCVCVCMYVCMHACTYLCVCRHPYKPVVTLPPRATIIHGWRS
jgi:hypothetical protein